MGYFQPSALGPRCETSRWPRLVTTDRALVSHPAAAKLSRCPQPTPNGSRVGTISLFGGRPIIAIYGQRMRLEPQLPRFDHRINSHL